MKAEIETKLEEMAMRETTPFCYLCYCDCPKGLCIRCGSDDLMRRLPGCGVEYGVDWVFEYLLSDLESVDIEEIFEGMLEDVYGETAKVGPLEVDMASTLKNDSVWWRTAKWEYLDSLLEDEMLTEIKGKYYWTSDLEDHL